MLTLAPGVSLTPDSSARNLIVPVSAGVVPLTLQGTSGQTGSLVEYNDSDGQRWTQVNPANTSFTSFRPGNLFFWSTTDQTTNYGRVQLGVANSGAFWLFSDRGGTGAVPTLNIGVGPAATPTYLNIDAGHFFWHTSGFVASFTYETNKAFSFQADPRTQDYASLGAVMAFGDNGAWTGPGSVNTQTFVVYQPTWKPTTGTGKFVAYSVAPTINQTGSATGDYTAFQVNVIETAATGANKLLLDCQVSGKSRWAMRSNGLAEIRRDSATVNGRAVGVIDAAFAVNTDATRQGRLTLSAVDFNATREFLRGEADGTNPKIGFLGGAAVVQQAGASAAGIAAVTDANAKAALTALQAALAAYSLVTSPA